MDTSERQPLLNFNVRERLKNVHFLLMVALITAAVGGIIVGIWLLVDEGVFSGGGSHQAFVLVNRTEWGAQSPRDPHTPFPHPPAELVVIIHTETLPCDVLDACSAEVRIIQQQQMKSNWSDIAYNFLVGGDGRTYEGRGWDSQAAFATLVNNRSLGLAFIGSFERAVPPPVQLAEAQTFITEAVKRNKLSTNYKLVGHNQVSSTTSPGTALYNVIKGWPHWKDCYMKTCF